MHGFLHVLEFFLLQADRRFDALRDALRDVLRDVLREAFDPKNS